MPGASIAINQVGNPIPFGTPGVARDDIWQSNPVVCQSALSGNVTYQWAFLDKPPGSAATFTGGNTATATFTPDLLGSYRIQLTTNGGGLGNVMVLIIRVRKNSSGTLQNDGICLPAFGERVGEDNVLIPPVSGPQNVRGYAPFFETLLAYILTLGGGGGGGSSPPYSQDCGAGGTITYAGPSVVPSVVILTGSPGADFAYVLPSSPYSTVLANTTGVTATTDGLEVPSFTSVPIFRITGVVVGGLASPMHGDVDVYAGDPTFLNLVAIGAANQTDGPVTNTLPIYGTVLNPKDATTPNDILRGQGTGAPIGEDTGLPPGTSIWYTETCGLVAQDQSGATTVLAPVVLYPNAPWSTQALSLGGPNNGSAGSPANCTIIADSLVGQAFDFAEMLVAVGTTGENSSTRATIVVMARVVASDTGTDTVGDRYTLTQDYDFDLVAGAMTVTPVGSPVVTSLVQVGGGSIGSFVFNLNAAGAVIQVEYDTQSCSTFDAGVQVDLAIFSNRSYTI
jgi:hypothetical protein